jgi:hypothetical protein
LRQNVGALVVDEIHLLDAELADFLLAEILALPARTPARTARATASRTAVAPRTTVPATRTSVSTTFAAPAAAGAAFAPRCWSWCLYLFVCHNFHPFSSLALPALPERKFACNSIVRTAKIS